MSKLYTLNIVFLIVSIIAFIPLTIEVFGGMNSDIMIVSVCVMGIGILGNSICAIIRVIRKFAGE